MQVKQQYELIVLPKTLTILNFFSKGLYSIQISLSAQLQGSNQIVRGFPVLVHGPDAVRNQQKKARIIVRQNKMAYVSQNFYITFSSQNISFHTFPVFKLQLERQKRYKVWLDFNLTLTQYRLMRNPQSSASKDGSKGGYLALGAIDQKVVVVDSKRLYINRLCDVNSFQRVLFNQPDYFSYSDTYIFSMRCGKKLRAYPINLQTFSLSSIQQRSKFHIVKSQIVGKLVEELSEGQIAAQKQIKRLFTLSILQFYKQMIITPIRQYRTLAHAYHHFRAMTLTLGNSNLIDDIAIPYLDYVGGDILTLETQTKGHELRYKQLIMEYYQVESQMECYVEIVHQAQLIGKNKQWLFNQFMQLLAKITYNVFQVISVPLIKDKQMQKDNRFIFKGDILREKSKCHLQFISQRTQYCKKQSIIQDVDLKHPFIMLQGYQQQGTRRQNTISNRLSSIGIMDNLVVFVHGYQGSDFDLQMAKFTLQMYSPSSYCLMSMSIQDEMDEPIQYLGVQLATEIKEHIKQTYNGYKRINFVGYSLGGIIIREAMRHLQQFKDKMNLFISLASPHTGTIQGGNILIKTGIWYLINFQNAKNIKQLHCQFQGKQQQNFILKKLSQCQTLSWFNKFVVASSQQDSFVPYSSSRIDGVQCSMITKLMCENIKKRVRRLERVEVWFEQDQKTGAFDKILGRKAHIQFLQNKVFLNCLFRLYARQF